MGSTQEVEKIKNMILNRNYLNSVSRYVQLKNYLFRENDMENIKYLKQTGLPSVINLNRLIIIMSLERFMKVYTFLPIEERKLTIVVIDGEPINWKRAYKEIKEKTGLGKKILKLLIERDLI